MLNRVIKNQIIQKNIWEFLRYGIVGGIAFLVDFALLFTSREFIFTGNGVDLYCATACGFVGGITVNTLLSIRFVFLEEAVLKKERGKNLKDILLITMVGLVGLFLTEIGMYIGTQFLFLHYLIVKIIVTGIVLIWNYIGRKVIIFN